MRPPASEGMVRICSVGMPGRGFLHVLGASRRLQAADTPTAEGDAPVRIARSEAMEMAARLLCRRRLDETAYAVAARIGWCLARGHSGCHVSGPSPACSGRPGTAPARPCGSARQLGGSAARAALVLEAHAMAMSLSQALSARRRSWQPWRAARSLSRPFSIHWTGRPWGLGRGETLNKEEGERRAGGWVVTGVASSGRAQAWERGQCPESSAVDSSSSRQAARALSGLREREHDKRGCVSGLAGLSVGATLSLYGTNSLHYYWQSGTTAVDSLRCRTPPPRAVESRRVEGSSPSTGCCSHGKDSSHGMA
jgi:hypothetical protein